MSQKLKNQKSPRPRSSLSVARLPVDAAKLNMGNTYSTAPEFYVDKVIQCIDCAASETWTAAQQKWWYEDAGGYFWATAVRCRACRKREKVRIEGARLAVGHDPATGQLALTLREFRDDDLLAVVDLYSRAIHGLARADYSPEQLAAWAPDQPDVNAWRPRLADQQVLLALRREALVGFIGYTLEGHIDLLFAAPQSSRMGVASRLYAAVEARLQAAGVARLHTEASYTAKPFFASQGFEVIAHEEVTRSGVVLRRVIMEKPLAKAVQIR